MATSDPLAAYYLDKAVILFGNCVESEIDKATHNKSGAAAERAANAAIAKWVVSADGKPAKGSYRTPTATM